MLPRVQLLNFPAIIAPPNLVSSQVELHPKTSHCERLSVGAPGRSSPGCEHLRPGRREYFRTLRCEQFRTFIARSSVLSVASSSVPSVARSSVLPVASESIVSRCCNRRHHSQGANQQPNIAIYIPSGTAVSLCKIEGTRGLTVSTRLHRGCGWYTCVHTFPRSLTSKSLIRHQSGSLLLWHKNCH